MKQETLEKYSERFDNDESAIGNPETWGKRVLTEEDIFNQKDIDAVTDYIGKETSKQETLEEAAEKKYGLNDKYSKNRLGFIEGAKWQQERSYSEEDMIKFMQFIVSEEELENTSGVSVDTAKYFLNKFKNK